MSCSKLVYSVFVFFCFASSIDSSNFNTILTAHKYKCPPQQSRALLLFKQSLSSINFNFDDFEFSPCQGWLGSSGYKPIVMNWNTNTDCCDWNGVTCNYLSGDVVSLDLSCGMLQGTIHPNSTLFDLPHLQRLNLAFNNFSNSQIPREIGRFSRSLTHLNISECWFSGQVPTEITLLQNLVSLDLSRNYFSLKPHVLVSLLRNSTSMKELSLANVNISSVLPKYINISSSSLKLLNLRSTGLHGKLPDDIFNSQSLEIVDLSDNSLTGQIPSAISLLPKLVSLDLSWNYFRLEPQIFNKLLNNSTLLRDLTLPDVSISWVIPTDPINISSSLKYLDLYNCSLMGSLPKFPLNLTHLTDLDLSNNNLKGTLPSWLFTLPYLQTLYLDNNMFSGDVPFNSSALPSLKSLSLGQNQLGGLIDQALIRQLTNLTWLDLSFNNFSSDWELNTLLSSLTNLENLYLSYSGLSITASNATHYVNPNLQHLLLASCKINVFPESLRSMRNLEWLDLSSNEIHGDIPIWAGEIGGGETGGDDHLMYLNLSHNSITGMPQFQWYLHELYLQSNQILGPFPPSICNMRSIRFLIMSNNRFGGVIPRCVGNMSSSLEMIDLGNNRFQGTIPNVFVDFVSLEGLILSGNQLQGEVPSSLSTCQSLKVIDLGNNHLNGTLPHWLGDLPNLQALILKSNNFHGPVVTSPTVESPFPSLRVLDLSYNGFVGQLPQKYFENLKTMMNGLRSTKLEYLTIGKLGYLTIRGLYYSVVMGVKGQELSFVKISVDYMIVDLSNNKFEGDIPNIIGNLTSLIVLNLSHNSLTGRIPQDLGKLSKIESLDLSWNQLTGEIPRSLADLTFLGFLNLSQNHLVGPIPAGKQFNTFDGNSFGGNLNLCGLPLPKKCNENPVEPQLDDDVDGDEEENGFTWKVVILGYGCGTLFGFVMGYLMLSTGRPKWFNAIADEGERMILTRQKKRR